MDTHALQSPTGRSDLSRWLAAGFVFGAVSVLIFHQGAFALLHAMQLTPRTPYSMQHTAPLGVPVVLSLALWGGLWGIVLAASFARLGGASLVLAALVFGALAPTLVAWFVVAPLKGQPLAAGGSTVGMAIGLIVNGAWGLGTGLGLAWLRMKRRPVTPDRFKRPI